MHDSDRFNAVANIMQVAGLLDKIDKVLLLPIDCRVSEKKSKRGTEASVCGVMQEPIFNLLIVLKILAKKGTKK